MINFKKDSLKYFGNYRGKVLSNTDSSNLGRIKVEIFGLFDGISASDLPWAIPAFPLSNGAGTGFGSFNVPEVDTFVWCFFETGDIYQPVYFAEATDGVHGLPSERLVNYPSRKICKTKSGIVIFVDDSAEEIQVTHPSGTSVVIDTDGNIILTGGDITLTGGDITITGEAIVVEGTTVNINP